MHPQRSTQSRCYGFKRSKRFRAYHLDVVAVGTQREPVDVLSGDVGLQQDVDLAVIVLDPAGNRQHAILKQFVELIELLVADLVSCGRDGCYSGFGAGVSAVFDKSGGLGLVQQCGVLAGLDELEWGIMEFEQSYGGIIAGL